MTPRDAIIRLMHLIRSGKVTTFMTNTDIINAVLGEDGSWVDAERNFPEVGVLVLFVDEDGDLDIGEFDDPEWYNSRGFRAYPTHWMPLPEKPKQHLSTENK